MCEPHDSGAPPIAVKASRAARRAFGRLAGLLAALLCLAAPAWAEGEGEVDLELVLAVDASGSVDETEYALQISGIAAAFRDSAVQAAIGSGPQGRIAVTLATWAEANRPKDALPWHLLSDRSSAERFAAAVQRHPRRIPAGGTGIGKAVMFALRLIELNGYRAARRVVDVSGDGRETAFREWSVPVSQARVAAAARGVTVNGLAILTDEPELEAYYRNQVIVGVDAFAMRAPTFADFAAAIRDKLIREIEYRPIVSGGASGRQG